MHVKLMRASLLLVAVATFFLAANITAAQENASPKKRLRSPATARGFIGGESNDGYVIRARRGQVMTVRISWRHVDDNRAEFSVSDSAEFGGQVEFGKLTYSGRRWRGKIPQTGDYYIYVVAHPSARYILKVTLK